MYVLGIDTSTMTGGVALLSGQELVGESVLNIQTTHSERLLPALEELLAQGNLTVQDLNLVSAVTGPGSFTGIRIGVATAKALSYALEVPSVGVTTLEGYGWQFGFFSGLVLALVDARRGNVFWQAFKGGVRYNEPSYGSLQEVFTWCSQESDQSLLFVGDGAIQYREEINKMVPDAKVPPLSQSLLRPSAVAHLGYHKFLAGQKSNAFTLNPTYMRQTEAERKWQKQV